MRKVTIKFTERVKYSAELDVHDFVVAMPQEQMMEWMQEHYFDLLEEQIPDWITRCCAGVIERDLMCVVKRKKP